MATVYLGKLRGPLGFSPIVAIKSLHAHLAKEASFVEMFLDEARLAARLRHTNIVPVIDVHEGDDGLFLVLEYVHGESLSRLLGLARDEKRGVPLAIVSAILCDTLRGLHAAHEAKDERGAPLGIVHRDVSPQNVLVGVDGVTRVLDFGIAKAEGRLTSTREGQVKGKLAYMAPEQLRGEELNRQTDVYAAAVVLWETLCGARLFAGANEGDTVTRALFAAVCAPSTLRAGLPAALDALVLRGLARERQDRFSSAKEMELALQAIVPPAPPSEVGAWVTGLAFESLEQRARLIAKLEADTANPAVSPAIAIDQISTAPKKRNSLRHGAIALGALSVLLVAVGLVARKESEKKTLTVAAASASEMFSASAQSSDSAAPTTSPAFAVASAASDAAPDRSHDTHATRHGHGISSPHAATSTSTSNAGCEVRNADGTIGFDTACLRAAPKKP
jgi:eukaryotic-like serine/threonine-protein kinase